MGFISTTKSSISKKSTNPTDQHKFQQQRSALLHPVDSNTQTIQPFNINTNTNTNKYHHRPSSFHLCSSIAPITVTSEQQQAAIDSFNEPLDPSFLPIVLFSILLFALAQSFINSMLGGERGLGAFLSDGRGFNKSGFRPVKNDKPGTNSQDDPLPWLKLPEFDFVDVAGQDNNSNTNLDFVGNTTAPTSEWE